LADSAGNLAVCSDPYRIAQDTACACRLFSSELWFDTSQGVRYWNILGKMPPLSYVRAQEAAAAKTVPGVAAAVCYITGIANRTLTGQVLITATTGLTLAVTLGPAALPWYVQAQLPAPTT
jgi:hypothetical protein